MSMTMQRDYDPKTGRWNPWVSVGGMAPGGGASGALGGFAGLHFAWVYRVRGGATLGAG